MILRDKSTYNNYQKILEEIVEYINDVSTFFSIYSIKKIGELGLRVDSSLRSIVIVLKGLLSRSENFFDAESLGVIRDLSRKYPAIIEEFIVY